MELLTISTLTLFVGMLVLQIFLQNKLERAQRIHRQTDSLMTRHLFSLLSQYEDKLTKLARSSHSMTTKKEVAEFLRQILESEKEFGEKLNELYQEKKNPFKITSKL